VFFTQSLKVKQTHGTVLEERRNNAKYVYMCDQQGATYEFIFYFNISTCHKRSKEER
jgi:hypothetical protein